MKLMYMVFFVVLIAHRALALPNPAAVYVSGGFQSYSGGIYTDVNTTCYSDPCYYTTVNHAIALVGRDDNPPEGGDGCWILRSSWGTSWGESGYMRIRYNAARVACEACYLIYLGTNMNVLPVTRDYDSDGKSDPGVYRNGYWSIFTMAGNVLF